VVSLRGGLLKMTRVELETLEREYNAGEFSENSERVLLECHIANYLPGGMFPKPDNFDLIKRENYMELRDGENRGYVLTVGNRNNSVDCFSDRDSLKILFRDKKIVGDFGNSVENKAGFYWEEKK
jgi:hypothetical protein